MHFVYEAPALELVSVGVDTPLMSSATNEGFIKNEQYYENGIF